ncbi:MAG: h16 [Ramlibacter sp.]|nr:h16 [Ramlibacter sp.]
MSSGFSLIVHLTCKPSCRDEVIAMLIPVLERMAQEPDFVNTWLHSSQEEPDILVLYETWACDRGHFERHHLAQEYRREYRSRVNDLLVVPRTAEYLAPLHACPRQNASNRGH